MCGHLKWQHSSREKEEAREEFGIAMTQQFNTIYGTDEKNVYSWQELCRVLGVVPVPGDLADCLRVSIVSCLHIQLPQLIVGATDNSRQSC
jgi:hypothetical protein